MAATIDDIARLTGFHRTTVSKVLANDRRCYASAATQHRIRQAARELHYVPNHFARSLKSRRSQTVGMAGWMDLTDQLIPTFRTITGRLRDHGYMPLFCESPVPLHKPGGALAELRARGVDGIIMHSEMVSEHLLEVLPSDLPLVLIRYAPTPGACCVVADRHQAFYAAVKQLVERGHRRIAFGGGGNRSRNTSIIPTHQFKLRGYRDAMRDSGMFDETLLLDMGVEPGDPRAFLLEQADRLSDVTAFLCATDRIAIEVMVSLRELGRQVPRDVVVIGFDDTEFCRAVQPTLSSFDPRRAEVGTQAVDLLIEIMAGRPADSVNLPPVLIERESSGPACKNVNASFDSGGVVV